MQLSDHIQIRAAPATVWDAILDPDVLRACIPGCQSMNGSPATGYEATIVQKIGPVAARFSGVINLTDMVQGREVTISAEGKGGAAGFAKGHARVTITPDGDGTRLGYDVHAEVSGRLAQLGGRLIDVFARKMADQFFERFRAALEGPPGQEDPATGAASEGTPKKGWFGRLLGQDINQDRGD